LEQLYYMYYNTKPKNALKGVNVMCFHPIHAKYTIHAMTCKELIILGQLSQPMFFLSPIRPPKLSVRTLVQVYEIATNVLPRPYQTMKVEC
jgi:hypothetical protein